MSKKNKLGDLNDHLFMQLEKLNDDDLKGDKLNQEIQRAHAMTGVAKQIINSGALALKAKKVVADGGFSVEDPFQIEGSDPLPCTVRCIVPHNEVTGG